MHRFAKSIEFSEAFFLIDSQLNISVNFWMETESGKGKNRMFSQFEFRSSRFNAIKCLNLNIAHTTFYSFSYAKRRTICCNLFCVNEYLFDKSNKRNPCSHETQNMWFVNEMEKKIWKKSNSNTFHTISSFCKVFLSLSVCSHVDGTLHSTYYMQFMHCVLVLVNENEFWKKKEFKTEWSVFCVENADNHYWMDSGWGKEYKIKLYGKHILWCWRRWWWWWLRQ